MEINCSAASAGLAVACPTSARRTSELWLFGSKRLAGFSKRVGERFARQAADDRVNQPAQAERDIACKRNGLAFQVHAAVALLESPERIQAPHKAVIVTRRQFALMGARVFDLCNACGERLTVPARAIQPHVVYVMLGVEDNCQYLLLDDAEKDVEVAVVPAEKARIDDLGPIDVLVAVVVFDHAHSLRECGAGYEDGAGPIVNQTVRDFDIARLVRWLCEDFAVPHGALPIGRRIHPKECARAQAVVE